MSDIDYSQMRSVADEPNWNKFVQSIGGELVGPLIKQQGIPNADYLFREAKVVAELKILMTDFAHSKEMLEKVNALVAKYPGINPDDPEQPLRGALISELKKPIQRIITKANRQLRETKKVLGLNDFRGVLICVNDNFRGVPPRLCMALIGNILSGTSYKSVTATIYQTNHYVELVESPDAVLLWAPMYSDQADDGLVEFINDLGRKWRVYSESIDGPYASSEERSTVRLEEATVVSGPIRNKRFSL